MTGFPDRDAVEDSVVTVLKAVPPSLGASQRLILTSFPALWTRRYVASFSGPESGPKEMPWIIDVKSLLGATNTVRLGGGGYDWRDRIVALLTQAGWPPSRVVSEYRPDWKTARRFDAVVLDREGSPFLIIESAGRKDVSALNSAKQELVGHAREQQIPWLCLQRGPNRFHLISIEDPDAVTKLDRVPSPVDCQADGEEELSNRFRSRVKSPNSLSDLHNAITEHAIQQVILGPTLPWNDRLPEDTPIGDWSETLPQLASEIEGLGGAVRHSLDFFLAWALWESGVDHAACHCPHGYLFSRRHKWLRRLSTNELPPTAILDCGPGTTATHTSIRTAVCFFASEPGPTYFLSLSSRSDFQDPDKRGWYTSLQRWSQSQEIDPEPGYIADLDAESVWTYAANDPEVARTRDRLARLGELASLSDHFEFTRGTINPSDAIDDPAEDAGIPLIGAREIAQGIGEIDGDRFVQHDHVDEIPTAAAGDFLVSDSLEERLPVVRYEHPDPAALSRRVIRLRPLDNPPFTSYLVSYLSSPAVERLLRAEAGSFTAATARLRISDLRELSVPLLEHDALAEIEDIENLERDLKRTADDIASARRSLFDAQGPDDFRRNARNLRETSALISAGLAMADNLDYKIRNFYPYPLAFPYRAISAETTLRGRYQQQLRFAENVLAFLGSLSLALVEPSDREELSDRVGEEWFGGITPGGWRHLAGSASDILGRYKDHRLADAISRLQIRSGKKGIGPMMENFVRTKNEYKHDEGPTTDRQFRKAGESLNEELEQCMDRLSFLSEFPIRQVVALDPDRQGTEINLRCLRYTGDHPGLPREQLQMRIAEFAQHPVKKGDLYIDLGDSYWRTLRPFIVARDCPTCDTREIYFLDKLDTSSGRAKMKSFERGHTFWDKDSICEEVLAWPNTSTD